VEDFDSVARTKSSKKPRAIKQLVRNPHMPHYRWHLPLWSIGWSIHNSPLIRPCLSIPWHPRNYLGGGGGFEAPSSSVLNSYHQIVLYLYHIQNKKSSVFLIYFL